MAKSKIINLKGEEVKDITLNDKVWGIEPNTTAMKKAVRLQLDATRQGSAKTKTRAEVSGGGRKPWRQKGTGRARAGSNRSPIWRGGGHVFALINRDYTFKINKKERVLALKSALSTKVKDKNLLVVDSIELSSLKTKEIKDILKNLKLTGKVLFVTKEDNANLFMAVRNMDSLYAVMVDEINVYDILFADTLVCDEVAIKHIEEVLK